MTAIQLPPLSNWQDFESLCCDLWRRLWNDPTALKHGCQGQPQHGVDVFGRPDQGAEWAGVQCKLKGTSSDLTRKEIEDEVAKARKFNPRLSQFILATTAPRDREVQEWARQISDAEMKRGGFSVTVFAWQDIVEALNSHRDVARTHFSEFGWRDASDTGGADVLDTYLRELWSRLLPVQMFAISTKGSHRGDILLSEVYTALDTTTEVQLAFEKKTKKSEEAMLRSREASPLAGNSAYLERLRSRLLAAVAEKRVKAKDGVVSHRITALEAAAAARRLVLTGPAGSGKSTFGRYLALSLVGERQGRAEANLSKLNAACGPHPPELEPWPHGAPLPVFVELRELVANETFKNQRDDARRLLDFIVSSAPDPAFAEVLRRALGEKEKEGVLVVLDGLDEIGAGDQRQRLIKTITAFTRAWDGCRILVTSRPYAYQAGSAWRLDAEGFAEAELAEFDEPKIQTFVAGWYAHLAARGQVDRSRYAELGSALGTEILETPYLRHLARRPLMLTMMADLHATSGGRLPGGRAALYRRSVALLLDRWNEVRHGQNVSDRLGMPVAKIREALERLAFEVHQSRGGGAEGEAPVISRQELWKVLNDVRREANLEETPIDESGIMSYLHTRSGILLGESTEVYRFPHRSFQEYLAACHLTRDVAFPRLLKAELEAQPELWREVVLLAAGRLVEIPVALWGLIDALVPSSPPAEVDARDPRFLLALYAALAVAELELWRPVSEQEKKLGRIRDWLVASLELGALAPKDRAEGGRVLAKLGDPRKGVGLGPDGVPEIEWVKIPAGSFLMGSDEPKYGETIFDDEKPQHEVSLPAFRISRYSVTNAQYLAFVEDGGYTERWRDCWTEAGWKWKAGRGGPGDDWPEVFLLANHPRIGVTWYEAHAFSRWLGVKLKHEVSLPTEAQWERAARGTDGRVYPWEGKFDPSRCNSWETGISTTTAVGSFPSGASPDGVLDMVGNVWEWCRTRWRSDYQEPAADDEEGSASRVRRGGSFGDYFYDCRCAVRNGYGPDYVDDLIGWRVVAPI